MLAGALLEQAEKLLADRGKKTGSVGISSVTDGPDGTGPIASYWLG